MRHSGLSLYRHAGGALLRAAVTPLTDAPGRLPDPSDPQACRSWLEEMWRRPGFADAVGHASPSLADHVDGIVSGRGSVRQVRRAARAVTRYWSRAIGRPTPFGLFAGVGRVSVGAAACVRWGDDHRAVARVDTEWLADIITRLEERPEVLACLDVVFTDLAVQRGGRLEAPYGPNRVTVRRTRAIEVVRQAAAVPIRFGALTDAVADAFPGSDRSQVHDMLAALMQQGFLITNLRAPFTVTDPLAHLIGRIRGVSVPPAVTMADELEVLRSAIDGEGRPERLARIASRMRERSSAGRTPLAVDLLLDCDVQVPAQVVRELEQAASVLVRLTHRPTGQAVWHAYHSAFCERYGTGTLVPLLEVVHPESGLGFPAGYPRSIWPLPTEALSERHERLLELAWRAVTDGVDEIVLSDELVDTLTRADRFDEQWIPPHVEMAARVHATSPEALDRGEFTLTVAPARAAGTLTSRFSPLATGSGLEQVYAEPPIATRDALPVQLSFPPLYPHAENICRIPAYLPHVLPLGEHRKPGPGIIPLDDLALTATHDSLRLVSVSRRRVLEPQVFHALALQKQPPPLARFLAHLPRAFAADWHDFDWGPHTRRLPFLPRIRYRRTVLSPARWRLTTDDLPLGDDGETTRQTLDRWRHRWRCPETIELRDADRTLRLLLSDPAHAAVLQAHLQRHREAVLTEAPTAAELGWMGGRVHEIAVPLVTTRPPAPNPLVGRLPRVSSGDHGQLPGSGAATWLYAKIHTHPERLDELIAEHLPRLVGDLDGDPVYWFVRYRSPSETDHLRLRLRARNGRHQAAYVRAVGDWAHRLVREGLAARLVFDTYRPETGRYGCGPAMEAAEEVFAADSRTVMAELAHPPTQAINPTARVVLNMVDIARAFLGGMDEAARWFTARTVPSGPAADREVFELVQRKISGDLSRWSASAEKERRSRAAALAVYRRWAPADTVLESLLHMHHNRAVGIGPDGEALCRRLARQAALSWLALQTEGSH